MSIESLVKLLEFAAKFIWPMLIMVAFALFIPDELARVFQLIEIRTKQGGYLWLAFFFLSALASMKVLQTLIPYLWRFAVCPTKKLLFPIRDFRTGVKQSRMRYYNLQMKMEDGFQLPVFQEVDSNGNVVRFMFEHGERFVPTEQYEAAQANRGRFEFPSGARMDWSDVFSGDILSGCWGISER